MLFSPTDLKFMQQALRLAEQGRGFTRPNPCVGAVIVADDMIIGEGYHACWGQAHAEVNALKQAGERAQGATCYVTLEPCAHTGKTPPCVNALIDAGIGRVVVATLDPNPQVNGQGVARLRQAGICVDVGLCALNARAQNTAFFHSFTQNRPYVVGKSAMSLDGRTAMADGESQFITGVAAREYVQHLRAQSDAIVTGVDTVLMDDPRLSVRHEAYQRPEFRPPVRVILDTHGRMPAKASLFAVPGRIIWVTGEGVGCPADYPDSVDHWVLPRNKQQKIDIQALILRMQAEGWHQIMVESGARVLTAFLEAGYLDAWHVLIAPRLMGPQAMPLTYCPVPSLAQTPYFKVKRVKMLGSDICVELTCLPESLPI